MASADIEGSRRLGVMGGTFDPIHYAHLLIAEEVRRHLNLAHIVFMPSGSPPHKSDDELSPAEDRYLMTVLATADNPYFSVSRLEIDRPGPSYTIDTVRTLNEELGAGGRLFLIMGADMALELGSWREPDAVLAEAQVVAAPRPRVDIERMHETLGEERAARIMVVHTPLLDISSTQIRERLTSGRSARYLCPRVVLDYIHKRGLYGCLRAEGGQPAE
ncbi:MAG: nicotinate-nucleotide adenylyltransferase [Armatimonadetes bacterium]|nr:nicotinate-nucleotide adenylyltransferase [Armatimonadota bacterium]